MIKLLHNNSCSKSRGLFDYLVENHIPFEIIDVVNEPLSATEIKTLLVKLNVEPLDIIRQNETLFKEEFEGKTLPNEEWIEILVVYPSLLQRPILIKDAEAIIGRPMEKVQTFLEKL